MKKPTLFYLIFTLSGFSGLIYESIWTHYLKLFLGHAAYAQTLVLAIFMGGMALGAYICSRFSTRWKSLLLGYALAEGIVGICALIYHPLFDAGINLAYSTIIPALSSQMQVTAFKWGIATLSILPQSLLLGTTFPLMSGAFLRLFPEKSGSSLAMLYFTNSIGAVIGVISCGFIFISALGFPGTISLAGCINIALAVTVWYLSRSVSEPLPSITPADRPARPSDPSVPCSYRLLLLISLGTGAASFAYEIGWIRMLALVLGSSTHAFELMLGAFLLGLATGGLWIKKRIDSLRQAIKALAVIQLVMGLAALATLPLYNSTFPLMHWLVKILPKTDTGYLLFNLSSYGISAAIMIPATFCAGMTLPLITNILFKGGHGEKSVGAVYAANTVGAIIGIFGSVHILMPYLGLKGLITAGAAVDMTLAVILVSTAADRETKRLTPRFAAISAAAVAVVIMFVQLNSYMMASGVYRAGTQMLKPDMVRLLFHKDGKTATVSVVQESDGTTNIKTNGKGDSAISLDLSRAYTLDEPTTILSGALPLLYKPDARMVANIGLGTGMTTQVILTNSNVQRVDTIEIEKAIIEGAQQFRSRTELVYSDPRSRIIIDDAKSAFSSNKQIYDIIISEPSNPWVSGVSGLFSEEFYRQVKRYMTDDGIFVQWLQLYEINTSLVASVMKALGNNFSDYTVYMASGNADLMIVARKKGALGGLQPSALQHPAFRATLERIDIRGMQDLRIRQIGTKQELDPLFQSYPISANSDYYPVLDQLAAKARFMASGAHDLTRLATGPIPYTLLNAKEQPQPPLSSTSISKGYLTTLLVSRANALREYILTGRFPKDADSDEQVISPIIRETALSIRSMATGCGESDVSRRIELLVTASAVMLPYLSDRELQPVWDLLARSCQTKATALERDYLAMFRAMGARNFAAAAAMAKEILQKDGQISRNSRYYLTALGMLASTASGNGSEALKLYQQLFGNAEQQDILFRLLYAQARELPKAGERK